VNVVVSWDGPSAEEPDRGNEVTVTTVAELDDVLDRIAAQAADEELPYGVQIHRPGRHGAIMLGVGHPERSFLDWLDRSQPHGTADRYGVQRDVPPATDRIAFDIYGHWSELDPERTQITAMVARDAAREYVRTGTQPNNVEWT
jgi:hypothetical protein